MHFSPAKKISLGVFACLATFSLFSFTKANQQVEVAEQKVVNTEQKLIAQTSTKEFSRSNEDVVNTGVDSNEMQDCSDDSMVTGFYGGWGHSKTHNLPHSLVCHTLVDSSTGEEVLLTRDTRLVETLVNSNRMSYCPPDYVVTGLIAHRGHNAGDNEPHTFECTELSSEFQIGDTSTKSTLTDSNRPTNCREGFAVIGISGGRGHSGGHNEPHDIECGEIVRN